MRAGQPLKQAPHETLPKRCKTCGLVCNRETRTSSSQSQCVLLFGGSAAGHLRSSRRPAPGRSEDPRKAPLGRMRRAQSDLMLRWAQRSLPCSTSLRCPLTFRRYDVIGPDKLSQALQRLQLRSIHQGASPFPWLSPFGAP